MSGLRKSLRKGKMKKESRSMSQPTGLDDKPNSKSSKEKKSLSYYLQVKYHNIGTQVQALWTRTRFSVVKDVWSVFHGISSTNN